MERGEGFIMQPTQAITSNKAKTDKLYELDYMRVIACLAVIIVHITAIGTTDYIQGSLPHIIILILNRSLKFTTPVFIFLSGVTSFYSYRKKEFEYLPFIKKRMVKVLIPYIVWCVIYYAVYMEKRLYGFYPFDMQDFMDKVFNGTMSYHLYFVIIIVQMYIVGPVFYKLLKKSGNRVAILIISSIITALCAEFIRYENSDRLFLKYMFFFMLGIYVTLEYDRYTSWINKHKALISALYVVCAAVYTAVSYYNLSIYVGVWFLFSVVSVFFVYLVGLVMKKLMKNIYPFVKLFGQSSYYIYLMHPLVLTLMVLYTRENGILSVTKRLIMYFSTVMPITILSCLSFTFMKNKIKARKKTASAASS